MKRSTGPPTALTIWNDAASSPAKVIDRRPVEPSGSATTMLARRDAGGGQRDIVVDDDRIDDIAVVEGRAAVEQHAVLLVSETSGTVVPVATETMPVGEAQELDAVDRVGAVVAVAGDSVDDTDRGDRVFGEGAAEHRGVDADAAGQHVVAGAADQRVVAVEAVDAVVAAAARQDVVERRRRISGRRGWCRALPRY